MKQCPQCGQRFPDVVGKCTTDLTDLVEGGISSQPPPKLPEASTRLEAPHPGEENATSPLPRYVPSGACSRSIIRYTGLATLGSLVIGVVFQALEHWIAHLWLGILLTFVWGLTLGGLAASCIKPAHCRSRLVALLSTLLIVAASLGAGYVCAYKLGSKRLAEQAEFSPAQVAPRSPKFSEWLQLRIDSGWRLKRSEATITGGLVIVVWLLESIIILSMALVVARDALRHPYCEKCLSWTTELKMFLFGHDKTSISGLLTRGDLAGIIKLPGRQPSGGAEPRLEYVIHMCSSCNQAAWLTVSEVKVPARKRRSGSEKRSILIDRVALDRQHKDILLTRFEQIRAASFPG